MVVGVLCAIAGVPEQRTGGRLNDYRKLLSELFALRVSKGRALEWEPGLKFLLLSVMRDNFAFLNPETYLLPTATKNRRTRGRKVD